MFLSSGPDFLIQVLFLLFLFDSIFLFDTNASVKANIYFQMKNIPLISKTVSETAEKSVVILFFPQFSKISESNKRESFLRVQDTNGLKVRPL